MEHETIRSATALVDRILSSEELTEKVKADPKEELPKIAKQIVKEIPPPAYMGDRWVYRIVVLALGLTVIIVVGGVIGIVAFHQGEGDIKIPDVLTAIGAASVGALAGLLAPSPNKN